jgi:polar amino acid transport system substrate-binding protein
MMVLEDTTHSSSKRYKQNMDENYSNGCRLRVAISRVWCAVVLVALVVTKIGWAQEVTCVTANLPPYTVEDSPQEPGFSYELLQAVFEKAGLPAQCKFHPWGRAQMIAKQPENSHYMIFSLTRTPDREEQYRWILNLLHNETAFITLPGKEQINSVAEAREKNLRVGVNQETPWHKFLLQENYEKIDLVTSEEANAKKLMARRIDAWYVPIDRGFYYLKKLGLQEKPVAGKPLQTGDSYLAANLKFTADIAAKLQTAFEAVKQEKVYEKLYNKYFGFGQ